LYLVILKSFVLVNVLENKKLWNYLKQMLTFYWKIPWMLTFCWDMY